MKYELKKKVGFFRLFKYEIIGFIICAFICLLIFDWFSIRKIFAYEIFWNYVNRSAIIIYAIYLIVRATVYLYRHTYIPLTEEELEKNNIHTIKEYNQFLYKFFLHHSPVRKVRDEIIETAEKYILKINEDGNADLENKEDYKIRRRIKMDDLYFINHNLKYVTYLLIIGIVEFFVFSIIVKFVHGEVSLNIYFIQFMIWVHLFFEYIYNRYVS